MEATLKALIETFNSNSGNSVNAAAVAFALGEREEFEGALEWIERAIELDSGVVEYYGIRGRALASLKRIEESIASFNQAIAIAPSRYLERAELANLYATHLSDYERAELIYYEAIRLAPGCYQSYLDLANCLIRCLSFRKALAKMEERVGALGSPRLLREVLSRSLWAFGRYDEAQECCHEILSMAPGNPTALNMLALTHTDLHNLEAAAHYHIQAIQANSDNFNVYQLYMAYLIRIGDLPQAQYIFRKANGRLPWLRPPLSKRPTWDGTYLRGRAILLESMIANGFGDEINFIRFASLLKDLGGTVILRTHRYISSLMRTIPSIDFVTERFCECPPYDCVFDPLYLMLILDVTTNTFEEFVPYLHPTERLAHEWVDKTAGYTGCKIGIVWKSSREAQLNIYTNKNVPSSLLASLADIPGATCFSLQVDGSYELGQVSVSHPIIDLARDFNNFMDTAAAISALDLIVTIDTSAAHVAGALGKPVFLMLPYAPCWRWGVGRVDSPWYPTMKLFQQSSPGDWKTVIGKIAQKVEEFIMRERTQNGWKSGTQIMYSNTETC